MMKLKITVFSISLLGASIACAQDDAPKRAIVFGTGGAGGTYSTTFDQWRNACSAFPLQEHKVQDPAGARNTTGTTENLDLLLANKIQGAYVQADAVWNIQQRDPNVQNLRTLTVLYPEAVHVIARAGSITVKGTTRTLGIEHGADVQKTLTSVADLAGLTVVAWGGSKTTSEIIRDHMLSGKLNVLEVKNNVDALKLVQEGKAHAVIAVGGYPLDWVRTLNSSWKLLAFPKALRAKAGSSYQDTTLTYTGMGMTGVESGFTQSMLIAQNFGTKRAKEITAAFDCMVTNHEDIADADGAHPVWKKINFSNQGNILPPFPFVRDVAPATPAPAPAKKRGG